MYQEVDKQTAFLAALEGKTVLGISALTPKEIYNLTEQINCLTDDGDRFIIDMPEPAFSAEPEPEVVLLSAENPVSVSPAPKKPSVHRGNKGVKHSKNIDDGKIRALHNAGWSIAKIADEMGIGESTVYKHLDDMQKAEKGET